MRTRALLIALACAACHVGNPLVDEFDPDEGIPKIQCNLPPLCVPWVLGQEPPDHSAEAVSLKPCMKLCGFGDIEQDGCPQEQKVTSLPTTAVCKDLEPKLMPGEEQRWDGIDWQDVNLVLRADKPLRVSWVGGRLQHVYIELHGPIELYMEQLEVFEDVRLQAEATPAGKPYIELADMGGKTVSVGTKDNSFAGNIKLRAVQLNDLDLRADSLTIENSLLELAGLRADSLMLTDVTMHAGLIDAKNARMSVFVVQDAQVELCGDVRLVAGTLVRSTVKACPDSLLRIYNCTVGSASLDGAFELDDTTLEYVAVGVNESTRVLAYDSRVSSTAVCEKTELLAMGGGSTLKCSGCTEVLNSPEAQPACTLNDPPEKLLKNFCKTWTELGVLPLCEGELPASPDRIR